MRSYLYVTPSLTSVGSFDSAVLEDFTERHHFHMPLVSLEPAPSARQALGTKSIAGVVVGLDEGLPGRPQLRLFRSALRRRLAVYAHWPAEQAIEVVDAERLRSFWLHRIAYRLARKAQALKERRRTRAGATSAPGSAARVAGNQHEMLAPFAEGVSFLAADYTGTLAHVIAGIADVEWAANSLGEIVDYATANASEGLPNPLLEQLLPLREAMDRIRGYMLDGRTALERVGTIVESLQAQVGGQVGRPAVSAGASPSDSLTIETYSTTLKDFAARARPVGFPSRTAPVDAADKITGTGIYIRTDYWSKMVSGGSYGHTCYVAAELAKTTESFLCLMGSHYPLLDDLGVRQEVISPPAVSMHETGLLAADGFYYEALKARLEEIKPAYIYERAVLGDYAAARLSRDLGIPYILEYNGSEIAMRHSFGTGSLDHEAFFLDAERLSFQQASMITTVSDHVRQDVIERGAAPDKVIVNPNGVNCDEYCPATPAERRAIRAELGLPENARVVGFIGTFGGWHGIDVLAAALPEICRRDPNVRVLLIGEGNLKHLVLEAISKFNLQPQIVDVGRTEQRVGARLLKAADIYLSPHSSHMRDSRFFGSPTKLFEYMALSGGIVASDLEQLGEVLTPALRPRDFARGVPVVGAERAVLCEPGNVDEVVEATMALVRNPGIAAVLGRNARAAALEHFSWRCHVERIWQQIYGGDRGQSWR